jgi:hypothetical protein
MRVGSVGSGTFGRRATASPSMVDAGLGVVSVVVAVVVVAAEDVLGVVLSSDPHPAAGSAATASAKTATIRAALVMSAWSVNVRHERSSPSG